MENEKRICNQICRWNDSSDGCVKPSGIVCPMSNTKPDAVSVEYGKWEEWWPPKHMILTGEEKLYRCSACTAKYADVEGFNYCPFCGKPMEPYTIF